MQLHHALIAAAAALLLAACGDSPQDTPPPEATRGVPSSATTSPKAYAQFAGSLQKSETETPLSVDGVMPPTSETAAPESL